MILNEKALEAAAQVYMGMRSDITSGIAADLIIRAYLAALPQGDNAALIERLRRQSGSSHMCLGCDDDIKAEAAAALEAAEAQVTAARRQRDAAEHDANESVMLATMRAEAAERQLAEAREAAFESIKAAHLRGQEWSARNAEASNWMSEKAAYDYADKISAALGRK